MSSYGSSPAAIAAPLLNVADRRGDAPALAGAGANPRCKQKKRTLDYISTELIYVFKWKAVLAEVNCTVFESFKIHGSLIPQDIKQTQMICQESLQIETTKPCTVPAKVLNPF